MEWPASDQSDDAPGPGDGDTTADCAVAPDGLSFRVRSERDDTVLAGRRYAVTIRAADACGNVSAPALIGHVLVPHHGGGSMACVAPDCGN